MMLAHPSSRSWNLSTPVWRCGRSSAALRFCIRRHLLLLLLCGCASMEDIWWMDVDAVVNTTNESLSDRRGVSGHILSAGGPGLIAECLASEGCRTGEAMLTGGGNLRAR